MKRVLLKISFDGTRYHGWQIQKNAVTVSKVLSDSLEKLLNVKTPVTGCSRTDAGVHAKEFYCHLDCDDNIPKNAFILGLNSILPDDISVTDAFFVENDFHARFNAKGKTYIYNFYTGVTDPFISRYAFRLERSPDILLMNDFCRRIIGVHDFASFSSSKRTVENTIRTIYSCDTEAYGNRIKLTVTGNGFLYNMVRIIAGTALEVGLDMLSPDCADKAFTTNNRNELGKTLPANGLFLEKVYY